MNVLRVPTTFEGFHDKTRYMLIVHLAIRSTNVHESEHVRDKEMSQQYNWCVIGINVMWTTTNFWRRQFSKNVIHFGLVELYGLCSTSDFQPCSQKTNIMTTLFNFKSHVGGKNPPHGFAYATGAVYL